MIIHGTISTSMMCMLSTWRIISGRNWNQQVKNPSCTVCSYGFFLLLRLRSCAIQTAIGKALLTSEGCNSSASTSGEDSNDGLCLSQDSCGESEGNTGKRVNVDGSRTRTCVSVQCRTEVGNWGQVLYKCSSSIKTFHYCRVQVSKYVSYSTSHILTKCT